MSTTQHAPVELFSTSILSNHKVRSRHERYISILSVKKIPFVYHDLASDEEAKSRWRRKARDPQIPGLLVHNEWRGTFEEFEESVEFGELDLFLKIDPQRAQSEAAPSQASLSPGETAPSQIGSNSSSFSTNGESSMPKTLPRATSHSVKSVARLAQPRAPSQTSLAPALPFAPSGSGFRKDHDAESFLNSLGISDLNLTEEELNEILEEGAKSSSSVGGEKGNTISDDASAAQGSTSGGKYPNTLGLGTSKPAVQRTYIPSADAGVKPLRLARMGNDNQRSVTASASSSASSVSPLRPSPSARFNSSHLSSKALAAEAQASISSRSFSSVKLRQAVAKGDKLEDAFKTTRAASSTDEKEQIVGREDLDDLMASLGLNNVEMTEEEAEAFLLDGSIPSGLDSHGSRLKRQGSHADRTRNEVAAREVARKARDKGYGSNSTSEVGSPQPDSGAFAATRSGDESQDRAADVFNPVERVTDGLSSAAGGAKTGDEASIKVAPDDDNMKSSQDTPRIGTGALSPPGDDSVQDTEIKAEEGGSTDRDEAKKMLEAIKTPTQASLDASYERELSDDAEESAEKDKPAVVATQTGAKLETEEQTESSKEPVLLPDEETKKAASNAETLKKSIDIPLDAATSRLSAVSLVDSTAADVKEAPTLDLETAVVPATTLPEVGGTSTKDPADEERVIPQPVETPKKDLPPAFELASPTTMCSSPSAAAHFSSSSPLRSGSLSPVQERRPSPQQALTPSRRAMDLTRSSSSNSVNSDTAAQLPQVDISNSNLATSPLVSPRGSEGHKSPKTGPKKFFSLSRKKGGGRSSSQSKRGEDGEDVDENGFDNSISPAAMSPSNSSLDPGYKRISAILREADEALEGLGDGSLDISHDSILSGHAFDYDLDEVKEDAPKESVQKR